MDHAGIAVTMLYILLQAAMYRASFAAIGSSLQWAHGIDLFLKRNFLSVFLPAGGDNSLAPTLLLRKNGISKIQTGPASAIYRICWNFYRILIALPVLIVSIFQQERVANTLKGLVALSVFIAATIWLVRSLQKKSWLYQQVNKKFPVVIPSIDEFFSVKISNRQGLLQ